MTSPRPRANENFPNIMFVTMEASAKNIVKRHMGEIREVGGSVAGKQHGEPWKMSTAASSAATPRRLGGCITKICTVPR